MVGGGRCMASVVDGVVFGRLGISWSRLMVDMSVDSSSLARWGEVMTAHTLSGNSTLSRRVTDVKMGGWGRVQVARQKL